MLYGPHSNPDSCQKNSYTEENDNAVDRYSMQMIGSVVPLQEMRVLRQK